MSRVDVSQRVDLPDGLYAVVTDTWAAGFVVDGGAVTMCAPILRRDLGKWARQARWVGP